MQKNKLAIFGLVTIVVIIAAVVAVQKESSTVSNTEAGTPLLPDLKANINDVNQLEITKRDNIFHVQRSDNGWQVTEKNNYPADVSKVKQVLLSMADLTTMEPKTKKADRYKVLGVEDPKEKTASSVMIRLIGKDGNELGSLIVGKQASTSLSGKGIDSVYVRKKDDEQSWLARGDLHVDPRARDWIVSNLFDISPKRVQKVSLLSPEKKQTELKKADRSAQDFTLQAIPKNKTIESSSEINAIADAISNIIIKDVESTEDPKAKENFDKDVYHAQFVTFDGLVIDVDTVKKHSKHLATFSASYDPAQRVQEKPEKAEGKDEEKTGATPAMPHGAPPKPAPLKSEEDVKKEVAALNQKFKGWIFEISSTKADNMRKTMPDLIKDVVKGKS